MNNTSAITNPGSISGVEAEQARMEAGMLILFLFAMCCFLMLCCRLLGPRASSEYVEGGAVARYFGRDWRTRSGSGSNHSQIESMSKEDRLEHIEKYLNVQTWTKDDVANTTITKDTSFSPSSDAKGGTTGNNNGGMIQLCETFDMSCSSSEDSELEQDEDLEEGGEENENNSRENGVVSITIEDNVDENNEVSSSEEERRGRESDNDRDGVDGSTVTTTASGNEENQQQEDHANNNMPENSDNTNNAAVGSTITSIFRSSAASATSFFCVSNDDDNNNGDDNHNNMVYGDDNDDELPLCAICLTPYEIDDEVCKSYDEKICKHMFHKECMVEWLMKHEECPCCRVNFLYHSTDEDNETKQEEGRAGGNNSNTSTDSNNANIVQQEQRQDTRRDNSQTVGRTSRVGGLSTHRILVEM